MGGRWWDWGRWIGGRIAWKVRGGGNEKRGCRVGLWRVGSRGAGAGKPFAACVVKLYKCAVKI